MIGGFELPSAGEISIGGEAMGDRPPYRRPVNTVFQNYALFPHMTVGQNVAYGLEMAGVPKAERQQRVSAALQMVRLPHVENRKPAELSGGQQQRVAVARALVSRPEIVFADEPTGNLDTRHGQALLQFLRDAARDLGQTIVMVTHDPTAAAYADRVVFLTDGRVIDELLEPDVDSILSRMARLDSPVTAGE
jgi:ABC-type Fe3+/spermidine/putrescine transport system ATPase subunit